MSNSHSSKYSSLNGSRDSRDSPVDISRDGSADSFETTLSSDREHRDDDLTGPQAPLSPPSPDICSLKNDRKSGSSPVLRMGSQNSAFKKIPKD